MKNALKKFENNDTEFFVMRSFITAAFEIDLKKAEYHIYYIKKNSNPDAYHKGYMNLKIRRMNRLEVEHFRKMIDSYKEVLINEDGTVFNFKKKPFDTNQCPGYKQFILSL